MPFGRCFYQFADPEGFDQKRSFRWAQRQCKELGGNLASIHSQEEDDFVSTLEGNDRPFWLGGRVDENGDVSWIDGSDFDYDGFLTPASGDGNCLAKGVQAQTPGFGWNDSPCENRFRYVCKLCCKTTTTTTTTPTTTTTTEPTTTDTTTTRVPQPQPAPTSDITALKKFLRALRQQRRNQ